MGHSVSSTGFRLTKYRSWKGVQPPVNPPLPPIPALDWFFLSFFKTSPVFHYSNFRFSFSPTGCCSVSLYLYSPVWQLLLDRVYNNSVTTSDRFFPLYLRFLKTQFLSLFSYLLSSILFRSGFAIYCFAILIDRPSLSSVAPLLSRFLSVCLKRTRSLPLLRVINTLLDQNFLFFQKLGVIGFFVQAAGRFSRTQRATSLSVRKGKTPFSNLSVGVDSFSSTVNLKYGSCSINLWVAYETV